MHAQIKLEPTSSPSLKKVLLYLNGFIKPKFIRTLNVHKNLFKTTRKKSHIHRKTDSLAFNYEFIKNTDIDLVEVNLEGELLYITKMKLLHEGTLYQFKPSGYELQIFAKLNDFSKTIDSALDSEENQLSLAI